MLYQIFCYITSLYTVEPRYNEVLGTMKITLLYQVSHYIRVKNPRNIKSWDLQNYLVIIGFCYIRLLNNKVPLYLFSTVSGILLYIVSVINKQYRNVDLFVQSRENTL